jgi:tRNA(Ile)-lysidine synthase
MRTKLHRQVVQTIRSHQMLRPGDRVGVAVSGGADSVALLLLLEELRDDLGITLLVVHFNHQLRGADSDADEQFVAELASRRGLEFLSAREDVAGQARRHGWNVEDAARRLRYEFFANVVRAGRATRVAVGHTADDQAETVLVNLLRGTGPTGLAGIYPVVEHVVRPLLDVRRAQLRDYLTTRKQAWREDQTNLDPARLRSRIRQVLLPQLERDFHAAIVTHLDELANLARADEGFWAALLEDRFGALVSATQAGLSIRIPDLLAPLGLGSAAGVASQALPKRLIRRIFQGLKGDRRQLTAQHVQQVLHLATESTSGHCVHLPGGVRVERSFDHLIFLQHGRKGSPARTEETPALPQAYQYAVELPVQGSATIGIREIGRRFCLKVIDWPPAPSDTNSVAEALDRHLLSAPLVLRNWRPGDAYRPRGYRRVQKVKRLFLERRISAQERAAWPVLTSDERLAWARGLPTAEEFLAHASTTAAVVITEEAL